MPAATPPPRPRTPAASAPRRWPSRRSAAAAALLPLRRHPARRRSSLGPAGAGRRGGRRRAAAVGAGPPDRDLAGLRRAVRRAATAFGHRAGRGRCSRAVADLRGRAAGPGAASLAARAGGRLHRLDGWLARRGLLAVIVVRLLPLAPYGLVGYAYGTTSVCRRHYLLGTMIGGDAVRFSYAAIGAAVVAPGSMSPLTLASRPRSASLVSAAAAWHWQRRRPLRPPPAVDRRAAPARCPALIGVPARNVHELRSGAEPPITRGSDDDADHAAGDDDDLAWARGRPGASATAASAAARTVVLGGVGRDLDPAADLAVDLHRVGDRLGRPAAPGRRPGSPRRPAMPSWPSRATAPRPGAGRTATASAPAARPPRAASPAAGSARWSARSAWRSPC